MASKLSRPFLVLTCTFLLVAVFLIQTSVGIPLKDQATYTETESEEKEKLFHRVSDDEDLKPFKDSKLGEGWFEYHVKKSEADNQRHRAEFDEQSRQKQVEIDKQVQQTQAQFDAEVAKGNTMVIVFSILGFLLTCVLPCVAIGVCFWCSLGFFAEANKQRGGAFAYNQPQAGYVINSNTGAPPPANAYPRQGVGNPQLPVIIPQAVENPGKADENSKAHDPTKPAPPPAENLPEVACVSKAEPSKELQS